jgi:hypothetical protein
VHVAVLNSAQDGNWIRLLFGFATFFGVCFGVQYGFFCTRDTWLHVGTGVVSMCINIETSKNCTRVHRRTFGRTKNEADKVG